MTIVSMTVPQLRRAECTVDGQVQRITPRAADLLAILLVSPPTRWVETANLIAAIWTNPDLQADYASNCISVYVKLLRDAGVPIENRPGFGYRVPPEARRQGDPPPRYRCGECFRSMPA
jgi:DNA-binding response OmpR family regulator